MFDLFNESDRTPEGEPFGGPEPGYLETAGKGIMRGGVRAAKGAAIIGSLPFPSEDEDGPDPERVLPRKEDFFRFVDERLDPAEKYWSVDTGALSTSKKIVSAITELPLQLVGGPNLAAASMGLNTGVDMLNQGVGTGTAVAAATLTGGTMAAMVALPQAGTTIKETLGLIASNPVLGVATDYATKSLLKSQGYDEQAKNIDPFDIPARSVDLLLGGIFGGVAHYGRWRAQAPTTVVDAIDTVEASRQRENLNPFKGADPQHGAALESALDSITEGRPVDVRQHLPKIEPEPLGYKAEKFRSDAQAHFGLTDEQADVAVALVAARAKVAGEELDGYINKRISGITGEAPEGGALYQSAWHGSPHDFDRFSLDKIGTGEGAQAYGHGLYFAGNKEVAEFYKGALQKSSLVVGGVEIPNISGGHVDIDALAAEIVKQAGAPEQQAHHLANIISRATNKQAALNALFAKTESFRKDGEEAAAEATRQLQIYLHRLKLDEKGTGRLYKVELAPQESDYLLWDKPFSEQSEKVKAAIQKLDEEYGFVSYEDINSDSDGQRLYRYLENIISFEGLAGDRPGGPSQAASEILHSLGVRGVKYLDGSNRNVASLKITPPSQTAAGDWMVKGNDYNSKGVHFDTEAEARAYLKEQQENVNHNYVIFNDADVSIVEKFFQGEKGAVSFHQDGKAVIHALESPDFTTFVHEIGHIFRRDLSRSDLNVLDTWMFSQVPGAKWGVKHEEVFARTFERYLAENRAPSPELETLFSKFRSFIMEIYQRITGSAIDQKINPQIRGVFDRLLWDETMKTDLPPEVLAIREEISSQARELDAEHASLDIQPDEPPPPPRQRTEAQEAASRRISEQARQVNRQTDSAITAIAKLGGLDIAEATSQWGRMVTDGRKSLNDHVLKETRRFGAVFKKDGMSLDRMRDSLIGHGYLPEGADLNSLHDIVEAGTRGEFARSQEFAADLDALEQQYLESRGYSSAADLLLAEQGDIMLHEGTDAEGQDVYRSAQEVLDELRAEIEMEAGQEHLYQRAAVCLNLG